MEDMEKSLRWRGVETERCVELARYIVLSGSTVRAAARWFGISKSTVHKEVTVRLKEVDMGLYSEVREIMEKNKAERHLRGGEATKLRYQRIRVKCYSVGGDMFKKSVKKFPNCQNDEKE